MNKKFAESATVSWFTDNADNKYYKLQCWNRMDNSVSLIIIISNIRLPELWVNFR